MRAIVTGQVGMDKKPYLQKVADFAGQQGEPGAGSPPGVTSGSPAGQQGGQEAGRQGREGQ